MDPERQPLLNPTPQHDIADVRCRRYRPLTSEEVLSNRQEVTWRRARFLVVLMFWAIMAMFLSCIACVLLQAPRCPSPSPIVSPVHLNFAPLVTAKEDLKEHGKNFELAWMG